MWTNRGYTDHHQRSAGNYHERGLLGKSEGRDEAPRRRAQYPSCCGSGKCLAYVRRSARQIARGSTTFSMHASRQSCDDDDDDDDDDDAMLRVLGACCDDDRNFTARLPHTNRTEPSRIIAVRELALR